VKIEVHSGEEPLMLTKLQKLHTCLFQYLIVLWTVSWLCHAGRLVGLEHRYDSPPYNSPLTSVLIAFISLAFGWKYLRVNKETNYQAIYIAKELARICPVIALPRAIALMFSSATLSVLSVFFLLSAIDDGSVAAASAADAMKGYELAECIYRVSPLEARKEPLAARRTLFRSEDEAARSGRNEAVLKVYGNESSEWACRCLFVGRNLWLASPDNDHAPFEEAAKWFEKSLSIYRRSSDSDGRLTALAEFAMMKFAQRKFGDVHALSLEACGVLPNSQHPDRNALINLSDLSSRLRDNEIATAFRKKSHSLSREGNLGESSIVERTIVLDLILLSLVIGTGLGTPVLNQLIREVRLRKAALPCKSSDVGDQISSANDLIMLDLCLGDLGSALQKSSRLLTKLGVKCDSNIQTFGDERKTRIRRAAFEVFHAMLLVSIFLVGLTYT
jgi:hypothetical protein